MEAIADTGLVQPRGSKASRPKPKRFKMRNNEAWDRLRDPILVFLGEYPGLQPRELTALLNSEGYMLWLPRGASDVGVVSRVLRRLERTGAIVQAGGWFREEDADIGAIADHESRQGLRGLKTAANAVQKAKAHGAIDGVDGRVRAATNLFETLIQ